MTNRDKLLYLANTYAKAKGLSLSRVSTLVRNDGKFFDGLAAGKDCTLTTFEYCIQWFSERWPEDVAWPSMLDRPFAGD